MKTNPNDSIQPQLREFDVPNTGMSINEITTGLTKREHFALNYDIGNTGFATHEQLEKFIKRKVNILDGLDMIKAQVEAESIMRVLFADALINELNKDKP